MMSVRDNPWTDEKMLRLRELWDAGWSTSAIGACVGMSKNAVIGKAHRLDLTPRPSPIRPRKDHKPQRPPGRPPRPRITLPPVPVEQREEPVVVKRPIIVRELAPVVQLPIRSCCWPTNDGKPWLFCGDPTLLGKSYCAHHCARAYVKPRDYNKEAA